MRTSVQTIWLLLVFLVGFGTGIPVQGQIEHLQNPPNSNPDDSEHGHGEAYWSWADSPLEPTTADYWIDTSGSKSLTTDEAARTRDAAETWSGVTPNLDMNEVGSSSSADITIQQEDINDGNGNILGETQNGWNGHSGTYPDGTDWHPLTVSSLKMDDENWYTGTGDPGSNQFDFESVVLHELGHTIGPGHPANDNNIGAVMDPSISTGEKQRTLTTDDIQATETVYGAIPEPTTWLLFVVGSLVMSLGGRRLSV